MELELTEGVNFVTKTGEGWQHELGMLEMDLR